ncbi:hypothetical protein PHJA_002302800 [Phtheirospermum japonicum]|uniref:RRM domain-containing protein n=1 Tax=Phtheirospermum japonicum TaxID=374723 RepID=A0A830CVF3_9LAMI|nr:hypothetical protein PHJA_002302800 [Phtheirospermum japonicum]
MRLAVGKAARVHLRFCLNSFSREKLEQQLRLIDQRYQKRRDSALGCLKDGNKRVALRFAAEMKMASQSRERCTALLDRVENVLQVIIDAESSKKVSDAIQSSTHAFKENQISVEEVEACLEEVAEKIVRSNNSIKLYSIRPIKGFWIVTYASKDEAEKEITEMNGKPLNGRVMFVDYANRSGSSSGMPIAKGPLEPTPQN